MVIFSTISLVPSFELSLIIKMVEDGDSDLILLTKFFMFSASLYVIQVLYLFRFTQLLCAL